MIKRRYFRQDHGDNSGSSSSSSSSGSDSDHDPAEEEVADDEVEEEEDEAATEESGEEEEEKVERQVEDEGLGYQSEDSSGHAVDEPSDDENIIATHEQYHMGNLPVKKASSCNTDCAKDAAKEDDAIEVDFNNYILKCKSVYKCKLCPRIMCLSEEMVRVHLESKRHARSKKLLGEGRLKLMLNSDGELQEEEETHAERHARTIALAQQVQKPKKDSGRQRQDRRRKKKRSQNHPEQKEESQNSDKKRRRLKDKNSENIGARVKNASADKKRRKTTK